MRCLNATIYAVFSEVVETPKKSSKMLQNFCVEFSVTPIHFQMF